MADGQAWNQVGNTIARIMVGDPAADAAFQNQQIKNETEYARQKYLAEQTVSEAVRRKQMEAAAQASMAAAAANQGLADERARQNSAYEGLGALFQQPMVAGAPAAPAQNFEQPGGMSMPGAPTAQPAAMPSAAAAFDLNTMAPAIVGQVMRGGIDPKILSALAIMPGMQDSEIGRAMVGAGKFIGKDDYVSIDDRQDNRNYELGANERLIGSDGQQHAGVDPTYAAATSALANQRNSAARFYDERTRTGAGTGGKVPRLDQAQMNSMIFNAIGAQGAQVPRDDRGNYAMTAAEFIGGGQPELYADMSRVIDEAYRVSGGRASAVQDALSQYLGGTDFKNFYQAEDPGGIFGVGAKPAQWNKVNPPDVNMILEQIRRTYGGIQPDVFTGAEDVLPMLQNVGSMDGWEIIE